VGRDEKTYKVPKALQHEDEENILKEFGLSTSALIFLEFDLESIISLMSNDKISNSICEEVQPQKKKKVRLSSGQPEVVPPRQSLLDVLSHSHKNIVLESPFNKIYRLSVEQLFSVNWELRHSSALILRSFIRTNAFDVLYFQYNVSEEFHRNSDRGHILQTIQSQFFGQVSAYLQKRQLV